MTKSAKCGIDPSRIPCSTVPLTTTENKIITGSGDKMNKRLYQILGRRGDT